MKRIFVFLITALAYGLCMMAQSNRVATLQHGSDIQAFYGENALKEACDAAEEGDVITLSAGEFNCNLIKKAITIRGEGISKTLVKSDFSPALPENTTHTLTLEGLKIAYPSNSSHFLTFSGTSGNEKVVISKCFFDIGMGAKVAFRNCNATIIQSFSYNSVYAQTDSHVTCINSIIDSFLCLNEYSSSNGTFDVQNCVALGSSNSSFNYSTIKNTIFQKTSFTLNSTNKSSHCLTLQGFGGFSDSWTVSSMDGIFTNDYHLSDNAAATYIGTDGTQIGVYGGMYPYDITPDYPLVKKLDVTGSHKNGKLNVKINVE